MYFFNWSINDLQHRINFRCIAAAAAAKSLQSPLFLCDPINDSPPGSPIPGILQARILEWVAISFSNAWKWKVKVKSLSHVQFFATPWTAAYQVLCPWDFPGKSTGVGCHCLLQFYTYSAPQSGLAVFSSATCLSGSCIRRNMDLEIKLWIRTPKAIC